MCGRCSGTDPADERRRIRKRKRTELIEKHGEDRSPGQSEETGAGSPGTPVEIEDGDHFERVLADNEVVLVDCYAEWCGPCRMMEPTIEAFAAESDAAVAKVDVDTHQQLAGQLGVRGVPTLVLYVDGTPTERLVGAQDRATLDELLSRAT